MNAEEILTAIGGGYRPSHSCLNALTQIADETPWFAAAHILAAIEAHRLDDKDFDKFLQTAAIYSLNRNQLYKQIKYPKTNVEVRNFEPSEPTIVDEKPVFDYPVVDYFGNETAKVDSDSNNAVDKFLTETQKKAKPAKKIVSEIAENKDIAQVGEVEFATEILGKIYAEQGYISKAIAVYEKLSLQDSKKSAYFAALIENLKKEYKK